MHTSAIIVLLLRADYFVYRHSPTQPHPLKTNTHTFGADIPVISSRLHFMDDTDSNINVNDTA